MKVTDIMTVTVVTVTPKSSLKNVWKLLFQNKINAIPVVDTQKRLQGIISKEDLLKVLYPDYQEMVEDFFEAIDHEHIMDKLEEKSSVSAADVMNTRVIFTRNDTLAVRALSRMIAQRVHQLPVLSEENEVVGMITKGDIFYALFRKQAKRAKDKKKALA